jgi:hypothetical protein
MLCFLIKLFKMLIKEIEIINPFRLWVIFWIV